MAAGQDDEKSRRKIAQLWYILSRFRRFQLNSCLDDGKKYSNESIVNDILQEDFNINHKIENNHDLIVHDSWKNSINVCTALHMLACNAFGIDIFDSLLKRGADFTVQNENGQTVLHALIMLYEIHAFGDSKAPFINSILSAHIKYKNFTNPRDNHGFSHLHAACLANNVDAINLFLDNGASINETVNFDAPKYPGYTPLHFAVEFDCFEAAQLLVSRGANINAKDSSGISLIDMLTGYRSVKLSYIKRCFNYITDDNVKKTNLKELSDNEKIIKLLLEKQCVSSVGLSNFQVASTLKDLTIAENLLNQVDDINYAVPLESPVCPGYTAAHFAAINSVDAVKMLAIREANLNIEDANGLTPLDICVKNYNIEDIYDILPCIGDLKKTYLSDGKTKLLDLVLSMRDVDQFKLFLQNNSPNLIVPIDSSLWPGFSILHVAVVLSTENPRTSWPADHQIIVQECLKQGMDVNSKNCRGQTPFHLAFRLCKRNIAALFLRRLNQLDEVVNHVDEDNLSYLHIACSMSDANQGILENLVRQLTKNNSELDIAYKGKRLPKGSIEPGWTPLHVAVTRQVENIVEILLTQGANLHATDIYGLTPIHWLLKFYEVHGSNGRPVKDLIFESLLKNTKDCVVDRLGLSYLHVACVYGHSKIVEKLLDVGSDINAIGKHKRIFHCLLKACCFDKPLEFLNDFSDLTPLHCAVKNPKPAVINALLRHGVDVFAKVSNSPNSCIFLENVDVIGQFVPYLWDNNEMQKCMEELFGLTKLHIACYMKNEEAIRSVFSDGIDVNVQVHVDSVIFAGCTPLHLLMTISQSENSNYHLDYNFSVGGIIDLLLNHGVDVFIANVDGDTPIHVFYKYRKYFVDYEYCKHALLEAHHDFRVNPMNAEGLSHFHLACFFHEVEIVEKFLQHNSVDINQPTDFFAKEFPGSSPLHLALNHKMTGPNDDWTRLSQTVDVLLANGANVATKDLRGDTPLHKKAALIPEGASILEKLVSYGANVRNKNIKGQTPMEKWSFTNCDDYARIFQESDSQMNYWNPLTGEGYIAKFFLSGNQPLAQNSEFKKWIQSSNVTMVDEMGRTALQNSVANLGCPIYVPTDRFENEVYAIESLMKLGIDIDHQDKSGKTALHYAAQMENPSGVEALLVCGADVNIADNNGKPAYAYPMNHIVYIYGNMPGSMCIFYKHIQKLQHLGLEVSEYNQDSANHVKKLWNLDDDINSQLSVKFLRQIELTKTLDVGVSSLTVFDCLSETGVMIRLYPYLTKSERDKIDEFFENIDFENFDEIAGIVNLQFRKMKARPLLLDAAFTSLRALLGFSFAGLCEEITEFLSNADLKNLIATINVEWEDNDS